MEIKKKYFEKILAGIFVIFFAGFITSCGSKSKAENNGIVTPEMEGRITLSGAFALYPLVNVWAEEFRKEYPNIRINISGGGAGKGMADVMMGAADLGMFSRDFSEAEKSRGVWWVAVTKDAVIPTISDKNPFIDQLRKEGITQKELSHIFLAEGKKTWKNSGESIMVYTRADAAGAAATWAEYLEGAGQESLKGIAVYGDPGVADAVKNDPLALGYNNVIYIYDITSGKKYPGLDVLPIDVNGNGQIDPEENFYDNLNQISDAIATGRYPAPPARELYLISNGAPKKTEVKIFLKWILTKGQAFVEDNGYIRLKAEILKAQTEKL